MTGMEVEYKAPPRGSRGTLPTHNRSAARVSSRDAPKKGCCRVCFPILIIFIVLASVGGVLLWRYLPEEVKSGVEGLFNDTDGSGTIDIPDFGRPSGDSPPPPSYEFNLCQDGETCCNGLPNICDLGVDQIKYAGMHNAMATTEDGFAFGANHEFPLEEALKVGYRVINLDVGTCNGQIELVHGQCILGKKDPETTFRNINDFLNENPRELIFLPLQLLDGDLTPDLNELYDVMNGIANFIQRIYVHEEPNAPWPTIGELLDAGKQIIIMHYNGPNCLANEIVCPAGFHDYFYYAAETEFSFDSVSRLDDKTYACEITRGRNSLRRFFGINNFVTLPSTDAANIVNQESYVSQHVSECETLNSLDANFIFVDFWTKGNLPEYVQNANQALGSVRRILRP